MIYSLDSKMSGNFHKEIEMRFFDYLAPILLTIIFLDRNWEHIDIHDLLILFSLLVVYYRHAFYIRIYSEENRNNKNDI